MIYEKLKTFYQVFEHSTNCQQNVMPVRPFASVLPCCDVRGDYWGP